MSKNAFFSKLKQVAADMPVRGDAARMPRGNITAIVQEMNTDHDKYGWLLKVQVTGGTNGVGEEVVRTCPRLDLRSNACAVDTR